MTSPANQQNSVPAPTTNATTAASYASAAGATKKPSPAPVVASGGQPPVVVGSSASPAQNAKGSSSSPVNGKPAATPAIPAVSRGASVNGAASDHSRKSSVTMAATGPNSYTNGGPVGGAKSGIQFGFDSPAMAHSTPQSGNSAPIPIPGGNARVPSPANSPSPIPQPSASGGRPPSGLQQPTGHMTFGSLSSDGERHMRQGSVPPNPNAMGAQPGAHFRRESSHSIQGENPGAANRSNFPQGGRGRGGYGPHNNAYNNQMGYPPNGQLRHTGQGRGMPQQHGQQPRNMPYPNSPQPNRSPAMLASMPNTPNMPPANMQPNMSMQTPPTYHYAPPLGPTQQVQCPPLVVSGKFHFKPPHKRNKNRREHHDGAASTYHEEHACGLSGRELSQSSRCRNRSAEQAQPDNDKTSTRASSLGMHRSASQTQTLLHLSSNHHTNFNLSPETGNYESLLTLKNQNFGYPPQQMDQFGRPAMPMQYAYGNMPYMPPPQPNSPGFGQHYGAPYPQSSHNMSRTPSQHDRPSSASQPNQPVVVASTPQQQIAQPKAGSNDFVKPKRSAAIQIKNEQGEVVDPTQFKQPASPAPSNQPTKAPPVVASTPTPPPKPATPSHTRTESQAPAKTAKEIQDELKEKIRQATQADSEEKTKPSQPEEAKPSQPEEAKPSHPEATKVDSDKKDSDKKSPAEPIVPAIVPPETEVAPEPAAVSEDSTPKVEADKPAASEDTAKPQETEEDEMERVIREMEEADARREKEEEEHRVKREAEKAEAKKKDEENRKGNAADADAKLREQEREMERLEEEKERRREEADSTGKALSVADALAKAKGGDVKTGESPKVDAVADKLADMNIQEDKSDSAAEQKPSTAEKRAAKPAALNLAPLNTKPVEPPQPSAALQSLKSARFLQVMGNDIYPEGIKSPNPALNAAVTKKGKTFKYDAQFLLQFQKVFTEQPSLEFHQQVKTLIGDGDGNRSAKAQTPGSARQGSRGQAFTGGMGTFNAPAPQGRTIPPGTTSEQRFAASTGTQPSRPQVAPMASFQRPGGAFPSSASMTRGGSQSGMGNLPNSPRQPSRSTRGGSRRDYNSGAKEAQAAKTMPLTAGQDLKPIMVSASGWKASSLGTRGVATPGATPGGYLDPEVVQRKVKAALNKMTPEKFDKISDQILEISSQSKEESDGRTLRQVIQLTFEKATDEAHWASMYAKFCKRMLDTMSDDIRDESIKDRAGAVVSGGALFRKYLLNRCQEEFERGWALDLPEQPEAAEEEGNKKPGEAVMLSDEYYLAAAAKRKGLGLVQFIGELFKLGMLTERIMHECVRKLVDYKGVPDEAEVESLTKLLRTVGANLDSTEKGRPMMDMYFQRIDSMMRMDDLPSRLKFMLLDLLDLRRANWVSKEGNKGPKTLEEVRADAEAAQAAKAQEAARSSQRGGGRPFGGRGDTRNFSAGYTHQPTNQVGMDDLRRLKGSASRTASQNVTLGPTSMFSSRSNSGRRLGPGGSLGRPGEDSGASSRTGTPPTTRDNTSRNTFEMLANMDTEHPTSPPSTAASPSMTKTAPDSDKKEGE